MRWTRRQVIAEEHLWRAENDPDPDWGGTAVDGPAWVLEADDRLESEQIAAIYRGLRKAREDGKDAPGAADFYYGEMEMRRQSPRGQEDAAGWASDRPASAVERWTLAGYWLLAGYGLRASRPLATLTLVLVLGAAVLAHCGFEGGTEHPALLFAIESSVGLLRPPDASLTNLGEVVQVTLRLLGPLLIGLTLLSFRGRVKR